MCIFFSSIFFLIPLCSLHDVAAAQATPWFPAFLACLQDPDWPIPGLSPWWSRRVKDFLEEKRAANFWTFHRPVAAVDDSAIQQTSYVFSARVFFMCSQLVLAGTKAACCCSEQPAWTAWTLSLTTMPAISCTGRWCCCASSLGHTCPMVSVTARVFD